MSAYVLIVDLFGLCLAVVGFTMAFRQGPVRRLIGRAESPRVQGSPANDGQDPLTYVLRIAGIMIMVFGIVLAGMVTLFHLA